MAIGEYYATSKNSQVKDFYARHGFHRSDKRSKAIDGTFRYELKDKVEPEPEFFKKIDSEVDHREES